MKFHPEEFAPVPASALSCLQRCVLDYAIYCPVRFLPLAAAKRGIRLIPYIINIIQLYIMLYINIIG